MKVGICCAGHLLFCCFPCRARCRFTYWFICYDACYDTCNDCLDTSRSGFCMSFNPLRGSANEEQTVTWAVVELVGKLKVPRSWGTTSNLPAQKQAFPKLPQLPHPPLHPSQAPQPPLSEQPQHSPDHPASSSPAHSG